MLNLGRKALIGILLVESFGSAIALPPRPLTARSHEVFAQGHHVKQRDNLSPYAGLFVRDDDDDDRESQQHYQDLVMISLLTGTKAPKPPNGPPRPDNNPAPPRPPQRDEDDDDDAPGQTDMDD
ncbi:uncharacterized protein CLUP02_09610 [Colletotrichum lupini]|uniref:Uncharacterized protein n=1 Tax=Colletotrichum lupini TaxID=145971 RepID=A0A9Q8WI04_9PEZI|nr:uncharacterized protein CLUP02_09610 [Colletotrichum lupini]UQC84114.1 hypothetical protein CLUP02_09610 [Colletotrichum lupini]